MINYEVLVLVGIAAFVLAKIWDGVTDRLPFWGRLTESQRETGGYVIMAINGVLMWSTALDMLPGFNDWIPVLGRVLTCITAAVGPSLVYDIWLDRPAAPDM